MGQVNVNPPAGGPVVTNDGGFGAGMIIGIILLILIVLVLVFYAGPQIFNSGDEVGEGWDIVVTVCDAQCPIPPRSGMRLRWNFADPALARGTEEERLAAFRIVRDGIRKRVRSLTLRLG